MWRRCISTGKLKFSINVDKIQNCRGGNTYNVHRTCTYSRICIINLFYLHLVLYDITYEIYTYIYLLLIVSQYTILHF